MGPCFNPFIILHCSFPTFLCSLFILLSVSPFFCPAIFIFLSVSLSLSLSLSHLLLLSFSLSLSLSLTNTNSIFLSLSFSLSLSVSHSYHLSQLMGGMALNDGKLAEMATGEGKTLVAVLPVYLNALSGNLPSLRAIPPIS